MLPTCLGKRASKILAGTKSAHRYKDKQKATNIGCVTKLKYNLFLQSHLKLLFSIRFCCFYVLAEKCVFVWKPGKDIIYDWNHQIHA